MIKSTQIHRNRYASDIVFIRPLITSINWKLPPSDLNAEWKRGSFRGEGANGGQKEVGNGWRDQHFVLISFQPWWIIDANIIDGQVLSPSAFKLIDLPDLFITLFHTDNTFNVWFFFIFFNSCLRMFLFFFQGWLNLFSRKANWG